MSLVPEIIEFTPGMLHVIVTNGSPPSQPPTVKDI
jgi:hypothetical protein